MEMKFSSSIKGLDKQNMSLKLWIFSFLSVLTFVFVNSLIETCILDTGYPQHMFGLRNSK